MRANERQAPDSFDIPGGEGMIVMKSQVAQIDRWHGRLQIHFS